MARLMRIRVRPSFNDDRACYDGGGYIRSDIGSRPRGRDSDSDAHGHGRARVHGAHVHARAHVQQKPGQRPR